MPGEAASPSAPRTWSSAVLRVCAGVATGCLVWLVLRSVLPSRAHVPAYTRADYDAAIAEVASGDPFSRYLALADAAKTSVYFGTLEEAEAYARELLDTAFPRRPGDLNHGNGVHDGHSVLGLVALRRGRPEEAAMELLLAGDTPGSPQADTFGPNMLLAKELLEHGDRETVIAYFEKCRLFWEMERGRLEQWTQDARAGRIPDFGANLLY